MVSCIEYSSYRDIQANSEHLLVFAQALRARVAGQSMGLSEVLATGVRVGAKPFAIAAQLVHLEDANFDRDDLSALDMQRLHQAAQIFKSLDPGWDIASSFADRRIGAELQQADQAAVVSTQALAQRISQLLMDPTVKSDVAQCRPGN